MVELAPVLHGALASGHRDELAAWIDGSVPSLTLPRDASPLRLTGEPSWNTVSWMKWEILR